VPDAANGLDADSQVLVAGQADQNLGRDVIGTLGLETYRDSRFAALANVMTASPLRVIIGLAVIKAERDLVAGSDRKLWHFSSPRFVGAFIASSHLSI
jgi:hypothetical protein